MFRIPQNFQEFLHSDQRSEFFSGTKDCISFKQEFQPKTILMKTKEFFRILVLKISINVCKVCTVYKNHFKILAGWNLE